MKKKNKGFTIVELLIYMVLLVTGLVVMTDILAQTLDDRLESEASSAVSADGRFILVRLMYDIGRADAIVTPAALGNQTNSLHLLINGSNFIYTVNGDIFELQADGQTDRLNSVDTRVSNMSFKRLGNAAGKNSIQTQLTIQSVVLRKSGPEQRNFVTTVGLR